MTIYKEVPQHKVHLSANYANEEIILQAMYSDTARDLGASPSLSEPVAARVTKGDVSQGIFDTLIIQVRMIRRSPPCTQPDCIHSGPVSCYSASS